MAPGIYDRERIPMASLQTPENFNWPYLALSLVFYLGGSYLKVRYRQFRPGVGPALAQGSLP